MAEIFAVLAKAARDVLAAHDDVPRDSPGYANHADDYARGRSAAEALSALVRAQRDALTAAIDRETLTEDEVARVRHDLRSLLQAVKGYAEMVLEESHDNADATFLFRASFARIIDLAITAVPHVDRIQFASLCPLDFCADSMERQSYELIESSYDPEVRYEERYHGRRVVLIDDDAANRDLLSRRLRRAGLSVRVASTGDEGLALLAEELPHVVLCDVMMPGTDGYEVLRRMKSDDRFRDIPVLMISALREDETIVRCIEAGADDYLPTPMRSAILHARIKACLNRKLLLDKDRERTEELAEAREELVSAIESMSDGFAIWGSDDRIRVYNQAFRRTYPFVVGLESEPFSVEEFTRASLEYASPGEARELRDARVRDALLLHAGTEPHVIRLGDGRSIEIANHRTTRDAIVSVHKDVTSRAQNEAHLRYLAMHDPLTGLANRATFDQRLAEAVRDRPEFTLLFVDLDRFKDVNDTLGHEAGDRLLVHVAEAIRTALRAGDLVARVGGDEFAVLLLEPLDLTVVEQVASRVLLGIGTEFSDGGRSVSYGATIGIAMHPEHSGTPPTREMLLQHADIAMYTAKREGRGRHAVYAPRAAAR